MSVERHYESTRIAARIETSLPCLKNHKAFTFVCTAPHSLCERLVCMDCAKDHPAHFSTHSKSMLRIKDFLDRANSLGRQAESSKETKQDVLDMKEVQAILERSLHLLDDQPRQVENWAKQHFEEVYQKYAAILKEKCEQAVDSTVSVFLKTVKNEKEILKKAVESIGDITKLTNNGHLLDLFLLLNAQPPKTEAVCKKITKLVNITNGFSKILNTLSMKVTSLLPSTSNSAQFEESAHSYLPFLEKQALKTHSERFKFMFSSFLDDILPQDLERMLVKPAQGLLGGLNKEMGFLTDPLTDQYEGRYQINKDASGEKEAPPLFIDLRESPANKLKRLQDLDKRIEMIFQPDETGTTHEDRLEELEREKSLIQPGEGLLGGSLNLSLQNAQGYHRTEDNPAIQTRPREDNPILIEDSEAPKPDTTLKLDLSQKLFKMDQKDPYNPRNRKYQDEGPENLPSQGLNMSSLAAPELNLSSPLRPNSPELHKVDSALKDLSMSFTLSDVGLQKSAPRDESPRKSLPPGVDLREFESQTSEQ